MELLFSKKVPILLREVSSQAITKGNYAFNFLTRENDNKGNENVEVFIFKHNKQVLLLSF
jgi:hypothetical protein